MGLRGFTDFLQIRRKNGGCNERSNSEIENCKCGCASSGSLYCFTEQDRYNVIKLLPTLDFYYKPQPANDSTVAAERMDPDVWVYPAAFSPNACPLPSTLAHEAVHFNARGNWTEEAAYYMEDICFGCRHYGR